MQCRRSPARFTGHPGLALAFVLALCVPAAAAQAQLRSRASAVTLVAVAQPRLTFEAVSTAESSAEGGYATETRRLAVAANVPYRLVARLPREAQGDDVSAEVLDRAGRWVALVPGEGVTLAEAGPADGMHLVQCRVTAAAGAATGCAVSYELVSRHPEFPMRVIALPGILVAQRP